MPRGLCRRVGGCRKGLCRRAADLRRSRGELNRQLCDGACVFRSALIEELFCLLAGGNELEKFALQGFGEAALALFVPALLLGCSWWLLSVPEPPPCQLLSLRTCPAFLAKPFG